MAEHYTARQRRGMNQIWTAAEQYDLEPLFLSQEGDGTPNLYMNSIVGYAYKWYGGDFLERLFETWAGDRRQPLLDDLAWLALENAVYQREVKARPVLEELREAHARAFFDREYQLSRQEWMAHNQLSYAMAAARWRQVLGQRPPFMLPNERQLAQALQCGGELEGEALREALLAAFARAGLFRRRKRQAAFFRLHLTKGGARLVARLRPGEITHTDTAAVTPFGAAEEQGAQPPVLDPRRARLRSKESGEEDRQYIERCFGASLYSAKELAAMERALCVGVHGGCRLWFTAGMPPETAQGGGEAGVLARQVQAQYIRNQEAFAQNADLYQNSIARLTQQLRNSLQLHSQMEWERSRSGRVDPERIWRAALMEDTKVFRREVPALHSDLSVELLLDASGSRQHCQETVAAQGYILAESLNRCGISVRIVSFCSLRGYTVLRILKDHGDRGGSAKALRYFATGWNRDGLAIRAMGELLRNAPGAHKLLLLLTDASPNDSHRIPPGRKYPMGREYEDKAGVEDAAAEVLALRQKGVRVAALYMGSSVHIPDARQIYGESLVRIQRMEQLADAAGKMIREELRQLEG